MVPIHTPKPLFVLLIEVFEFFEQLIIEMSILRVGYEASVSFNILFYIVE